jgi:hypothetical protein
MNAREMALRGVAAKRRKREAERLAVLSSDAPALQDCRDPNPGYVRESLIRVRRQLDRLHRKLTSAEIAADIDRLCSGISKLSALEATLAGRPGPGTLKPAAKPATRSRAEFMLDDLGGAP